MTDAPRRRGRSRSGCVCARCSRCRPTKRLGRSRRRGLQLLADDGCRVEARRTTRSKRLWQQHPEGDDAVGARSTARSRATTHMLKRGDFLKPAKHVYAGRAGASCIRSPADATADPADVRPAGWSIGESPTTARAIVNRVWQSVLRHRARRDQRRPRHAGRAADRIPNCSTGWRSSSWTAAGASSSCTG